MSVDIEKLERLSKQATPGPWKDKSFKRNYDWGVICSGGKRIAQCTSADVTDERKRVTFEEKLANAAYIAAACNAVPELIAEIRNLQKEVLTLAEENACLKEQAAASETKHKKQVRILERQAETLARYLAEKCLNTVTTKRWLNLAHQSAVRSEER